MLRTAPGHLGDARSFAELRAEDFGYLNETRHVYLDHTGAGLPPRSLVRCHAQRVLQGCFGNPHSENPTSRASSDLIAEARAAVLRHFGADPDLYSVIFTANATGGARLVGESYPFSPFTRLILPDDNHNSVNGIREFARARRTRIVQVPLRTPDLRIDPEGWERALERRLPGRRRRGLVAYPAQSNFTGVQHPLELVGEAQRKGYDVLLDAAAFVPTNPLDLGRVHPEFVMVSWYKVFGFPTGVGSLLARKDALARLRRPWFSGGTVQVVSAQAQWHALATDESAFEDGTVNFLSIPDVTNGLRWLSAVGMDEVRRHVLTLTSRLLNGLGSLRHGNGQPLVRLYGPHDTTGRGGTVALNLLDPHGDVIDERVVTRDTARRGISLRAGCFCNPGAGEAALGLTLERLRSAWRSKLSTMEEYLIALGLPSAGAVRVSLGVSSDADDVDAFLSCVQETYLDRVPDTSGLSPRPGC